MTSPIDWSRVKHFRREEFVQDPAKILPSAVYLLDDMRDAAGVPFRIHVACDTTGHVADSSHYATARPFASAIDGHFEDMPLVEQWLFAERFPWCAIGLYPFWEHPGLHLDLRLLGNDHPNLGKRWWRDRAGTYKALDEAFLRSLLCP
jgi:hypothetical protein